MESSMGRMECVNLSSGLVWERNAWGNHWRLGLGWNGVRGPEMGADRLQCLWAVPHGLHAHPQVLHGHLGGQRYQLRRTQQMAPGGVGGHHGVGAATMSGVGGRLGLDGAGGCLARHPTGWDARGCKAAPLRTAGLSLSMPGCFAELGAPTPPESG